MQSALSSMAPILMVGVAAAAAQEIHRASVAIPNVIAAGVQVELIRNGFQGLEGPVATPDGGLFFSDIPTNRTYSSRRAA